MATTFLKVANNAESTLASNIAAGAASLTVAAGDGAKFPSTFPFNVSIDDEIIQVGARTGDVLSSLTHAQEGTADVGHSAGTGVELRITAEQMSDIHTAVNDLEGHNHTTGGAAGPLTDDEHDGYSEYLEIATPSNPAQNNFRLFARASGTSIQIVVRSSQGQEAILATLLDGAAAPANKFLLLGVKQ